MIVSVRELAVLPGSRESLPNSRMFIAAVTVWVGRVLADRPANASVRPRLLLRLRSYAHAPVIPAPASTSNTAKATITGRFSLRVRLCRTLRASHTPDSPDIADRIE